MNCPYCSNEMEQGFVQSSREIFFGKKKHKLFFMVEEFNNEILIARGLGSAIAKAESCTKCKKIIIDLENWK